MPALPRDKALDLIKRRHAEWTEFHLMWRRLQDSLEGGDRYRFAEYAYDRRGFGFRVHNLIRHKREFPTPRKVNQYGPGVVSTELDYHVTGDDPYADANQDEYELRRSRTPVPRLLASAVEKHLSRIYSAEIRRDGPDELAGWWIDVDGQGTAIDDWMSDTVAPLLYTLGCLDLAFDRPAAPEGVAIQSKADSDALRLDRCIATFILPENVLWWKLTPSGDYEEVLILEYADDEGGQPRPFYRHWTAADSVLYSEDGDVKQERAHGFGRVPVFRAFVKRKFRVRNVGQAPLEGVFEKEREYYNEQSELILTNVLHAHPQLMAPQEAMRAGDVAVGPGWALPMVKDDNGNYVEWKFLAPDKSPAEFIRSTLQDLENGVDRETCQTKPAGAVSGSTVAQSGISKELDQRDGNDVLAKLARVLQRVELRAARYALAAIRGEPVREAADAEVAEIGIVYPGGFSLYDPAELAALMTAIQDAAQGAGSLPLAEAELLKRMVIDALPGLADADYKAIADEIDDYLEDKSQQRALDAESGRMLALPGPAGPGPLDDPDVPESDGGGAPISPDTTDSPTAHTMGTISA